MELNNSLVNFRVIKNRKIKALKAFVVIQNYINSLTNMDITFYQQYKYL